MSAEPETSIRRRRGAAKLPRIFHTLSNQLAMAERQNRFNFHISDFLAMCGGAPQRILDSVLRRLISQGRLFRPSRGHDHWVLVPTEYADTPAPPLELWLDHYCRVTLNTSYYVLDSHGPEPLGPAMYLMTPQRRHSLSTFGLALIFFTQRSVPGLPTAWRAGERGGGYRISSPAVTAIDLLQFASRLGGRKAMLSRVQELIPQLTAEDLRTAAKASSAGPALAALRALLSDAGEARLASCLNSPQNPPACLGEIEAAGVHNA